MKDGLYTAVLTGADSSGEQLQGVRVYNADVNVLGGKIPMTVCSWQRAHDDDQLVNKHRDGTPVIVGVIAGECYGLFTEPAATAACPPPGGV